MKNILLNFFYILRNNYLYILYYKFNIFIFSKYFESKN